MPRSKRTFGDDSHIGKSVGSQLVEALTEYADALESGNVEKFTYRGVKLNLEPTHYSPEMIKEARGMLCASQSVFGVLLGVSASTIRAWEQGRNTPSNMACRFMDEIRRDPAHYLLRLTNLIEPKARKKSRA